MEQWSLKDKPFKHKEGVIRDIGRSLGLKGSDLAKWVIAESSRGD